MSQELAPGDKSNAKRSIKAMSKLAEQAQLEPSLSVELKNDGIFVNKETTCGVSTVGR